jgi:hypothetical protein
MNGSDSVGRYPGGSTMALLRGDRFLGFGPILAGLLFTAPRSRPLALALARVFATAGFLAVRLRLDFPMRSPGHRLFAASDALQAGRREFGARI